MVKRGVVIGGVLALVSGVFVSNAFAEEDLDISVTVQNASIQLTVPDAVNLDLTPTSAAADFKSANLTIKVGTNNATGYTLTMSVPSTDISRIGAASGDPVIGTLAASESGYSQNDFTANKWGYKITGDNYFPITTTLSPSQWITDGPANNVDNIITLASKVNTAIPAGTYNTTLTFSAVANPGLDDTAFNIVYNSNGGTGKMSPTTIEFGQVGTVSDSTFTPPAGMKFDGWASSSAGAGPYIAGGVSYVAPASSAGGTVKILYAMWAPLGTPIYPDPTPDPTGTTLTRAYEIAYTAAHKGMYEEDTPGSNTFSYVDSWNGGQYQGEGRDVRFLISDMTPEICASATEIGSEAIVLDIRDQTSYRIVKARDGKCWMQDNLQLDPTTATLTTANTNVDAVTLSAYTSGNGRTGDDATKKYPITGVRRWVWSEYKRVSNVPLVYVNHKDDVVYTDPDTGVKWKAGVYYNFCAASAGSYCYNDYQDTEREGTLSSAEYDICPYGWRLPTWAWTSGTVGTGDIADMWNSYEEFGDTEGVTMGRIVDAIHIPQTGMYNGSDPVYSERYFATATRVASGTMQSWRMYASFQPYNFYVEWGIPYRCVAKSN